MQSGYNLTKAGRKGVAFAAYIGVLSVVLLLLSKLIPQAAVHADPGDVASFEPKVRSVMALFDLTLGSALVVAGVGVTAFLWFILDRTKLGERLFHFRKNGNFFEDAARIQAGALVFLALAIIVSSVISGVLK